MANYIILYFDEHRLTGHCAVQCNSDEAAIALARSSALANFEVWRDGFRVGMDHEPIKIPFGTKDMGHMEYRLYLINARGHFCDSSEIQAEDDGVAIMKAEAQRGLREAELWHGGRKVCNFATASANSEQDPTGT